MQHTSVSKTTHLLRYGLKAALNETHHGLVLLSLLVQGGLVVCGLLVYGLLEVLVLVKEGCCLSLNGYSLLCHRNSQVCANS